MKNPKKNVFVKLGFFLSGIGKKAILFGIGNGAEFLINIYLGILVVQMGIY